MINQRDEDGATTVLVALLAVVLFGAGALAIDVGQVFAKRAALQENVDLAVLAAAAEYGDEPDECTPAMISAAEESLTRAENAAPDQASIDLGGSPEDGDGYIACNDWQVDLWAPTSHVSYGMAAAVTDEEGLDVPAHAAAQVRSPATAAETLLEVVGDCEPGYHSIELGEEAEDGCVRPVDDATTLTADLVGHPGTGRLDQETRCGPDDGHGDRTLTDLRAPQGLNDDRIECFLLAGFTVGDAIDGNEVVLSAEIVRSPRFVMLEDGAGYHPAFITDEGSGELSRRTNGLSFDDDELSHLGVLLLGDAALPSTGPATGGEITYVGAPTIKVVVLVE